MQIAIHILCLIGCLLCILFFAFYIITELHNKPFKKIYITIFILIVICTLVALILSRYLI